MGAALTLTCLACGQRNRVPEARLADRPVCGTCGAGLVGDRPVEIDAATHDRAIRDGMPLLVDYWAAWCGPCRAMAPNFAAAARELAGRVRLAKLDTEAAPEVVARLRIGGIPLLVLWRDGREAGHLPGLRPAAEIVGFARG